MKLFISTSFTIGVDATINRIKSIVDGTFTDPLRPDYCHKISADYIRDNPKSHNYLALFGDTPDNVVHSCIINDAGKIVADSFLHLKPHIVSGYYVASQTRQLDGAKVIYTKRIDRL